MNDKPNGTFQSVTIRHNFTARALRRRTANFYSALCSGALALLAGLAIQHSAVGAEVPAPAAAGVQRFDHFRELSPADVRTDGWLKEFLQRQLDGLSGHYEVQGYPFTINFWKGEDTPGNLTWWPWEQTGYLSDGLERLGQVTGNKDLQKSFQEKLEWVMAHPNTDGLLGPSLKVAPRQQWPMAVFFKGVNACEMATRDPKIVEAFHKHYSNLTVEDLSKKNQDRDIDNLEGVLKVYEWTGDPKLLAKADAAGKRWFITNGSDHSTMELKPADRLVMHGVSFCEEIKQPVLLYIYTGNRSYLDAAVRALDGVVRDHMLFDGVISSTEFLSGRDPGQTHETCVISDFTWTLGYFLMATGEAKYADMIERAVFNAGLGCISKDFRQHQYFSGVNQVLCTSTSARVGGDKMQYCTYHHPMCCSGNVHRFMPNFAARMWMQDASGGLVASLYGPSGVTVATDPQHSMTVTEKTGYPFDSDIEFSFAGPAGTSLPFQVRIPGWCEKASITLNGTPLEGPHPASSFFTLPRAMRPGDTVHLKLPMPVVMSRFANATLIERGPLVFSYPIPENVEVVKKVVMNRCKAGEKPSVTQIYEELAEKDRERKPNEDPLFPTLNLRPAGPWQYALAIDESNFQDKVRVDQRKVEGYPWDPGQSPITLEVPARRVKGWELEGGQRNPPLPLTYTLDGPEEIITLVPLGSTRLRISAFPECVERRELPVTDLQVSGPFPYQPKEAFDSQKFGPEVPKGVADWKPATPDKRGYVDLIPLLPPAAKSDQNSARGLAYVRAKLTAKTAGAAVLAITAQDACEVRLNGKPIRIIQQPNQGIFNFPDWIPVKLKAGENEILLKVGQYGPVPQYRSGWGVRILCLE